MLLDTLPVHASVTDATNGEPRQVAAALLLMNEPADNGLTTGWYWTVVPRNPAPADIKSAQRWRDAVANRQGPFRDANAALAAAENRTPEDDALATRLNQAASLLAAGEIEATPAGIAEWLNTAADTDRAAPPVGPAPMEPTTADPGTSVARHELETLLRTGMVPDDADDAGEDPDASVNAHPKPRESKQIVDPNILGVRDLASTDKSQSG